jgi:ferredoxin
VAFTVGSFRRGAPSTDAGHTTGPDARIHRQPATFHSSILGPDPRQPGCRPPVGCTTLALPDGGNGCRLAGMTYVITEPCIGVKDASCVDVCPVDCIHATDDDAMYFIDPDECIDCGACEPECPVTAIFAEDAVPDDQQKYIQINADYFKQ